MSANPMPIQGEPLSCEICLKKISVSEAKKRSSDGLCSTYLIIPREPRCCPKARPARRCARVSRRSALQLLSGPAPTVG